MSLYKTILVTLEGTPTDRAIINHIKLLAPAMQSRVVLLHVASGVAAQYHRTDAAGTEVEESKVFLGRVRDEFTAEGIPHGSAIGLRRTRRGNHQVGPEERLRSGGDEHPRSPVDS